MVIISSEKTKHTSDATLWQNENGNKKKTKTEKQHKTVWHTFDISKIPTASVKLENHSAPFSSIYCFTF